MIIKSKKVLILVSLFFIGVYIFSAFPIQSNFKKDESDKLEPDKFSTTTTPINNTNDINFKNPKTSSSLTPKEAYAIIVGISDYPGNDYDLSYCDDDALAVYNMLINDYNFKTQNIIYLTDSGATKTGINSAFDQIASNIKNDDIFFFYYSGHGGGDIVNSGIHGTSINSPHPYPNYYDRTWSIYYPDAAYMRVHFDTYDLEDYYDYVYIGDSDLVDDWYYEELTGIGYNYWSNWIPLLSDNKIYIRMISDYSYTYWGIKIDMYEVETYDGTNYLCSYDSIPSTPSNYYLDTLLDSKLDIMNCSEKYIVLDACNTGGMISEVQEVGRYIMTACKYDQSSLEASALQHGVFTHYFLKSLDSATDSDGDNAISMEECYSYTYSSTVSYSASLGYSHHPQLYDGISGPAVLYPTLGSVSFDITGNSLTYSFNLYGTGLVEELFVIACNASQNAVYEIEDLTVSSPTNTGFGSYSGSLQLEGVSGIPSYGIYTKIQGNTEIVLNNSVTRDSDNDTLDDIFEIYIGLDPSNNDTDSDGLSDPTEFYGITDPTLDDTDGDSMLDGYEVFNALDPIFDDSLLDLDGDGLINVQEYNLGTYVNNPDTDGDSMPDGFEFEYGLELFSDDADLDFDGDGLSNLLEFNFQTDPTDSDTDDDRLKDGAEINKYKTDPLNSDTDGDGYSDGFEVSIGIDPLDPKITFITFLLNISGGIVLSLTGSYVVYSQVIKRKRLRNERPVKKKFYVNKGQDVYNILRRVKKTKPKPKPPSYPYKTTYSPYVKPRITPTQLDVNKLRDSILYGMPTPKRSNSPEGQKALLIANMAFEFIKTGDFKRGFDFMINALFLGVTEPMNGRIKKILLDSLNRSIGYSVSSTQNQLPGFMNCSRCGQLNRNTDAYCKRCGGLM